MAPKPIDKKKRRQEIALIALDLFAEKGFLATSMREIAEAADMGKGTLYEYFTSKEDLILNSIEAWVEMMSRKAARESADMDDPAIRLRKFVEASMNAWFSDDRTTRLTIAVMQMIVTKEDFLSRLKFMKLYGSTQKNLLDIMLDGVSKGVFRPEIAQDAETIAVNLMAYLDGIYSHYFMGGKFIDIHKQIDFYLDGLLESLQGRKYNGKT